MKRVLVIDKSNWLNSLWTERFETSAFSGSAENRGILVGYIYCIMYTDSGRVSVRSHISVLAIYDSKQRLYF